MFHLLKPQDIAFIIVVIFLLVKKKPKFFMIAGLLCLLISIPLFAHWIFFTAERLIYYAVGFLFIAVLFYIIRLRREIK